MTRWLLTAEAADYARMSIKTLMRHVRAGDIYGVKRGGRWKIDQGSIDSWYREEEAELLETARRLGIKSALP